MPISCSITSEKILHVSDLLTGRADVWYHANQHKRLPNEQTNWLEWDSYGRFKNEFMKAHRNHHKQREANQTMLKDYQRKGERMVDYICRNRAYQLIACLLSRGLYWLYSGYSNYKVERPYVLLPQQNLFRTPNNPSPCKVPSRLIRTFRHYSAREDAIKRRPVWTFL